MVDSEDEVVIHDTTHRQENGCKQQEEVLIFHFYNCSPSDRFSLHFMMKVPFCFLAQFCQGGLTKGEESPEIMRPFSTQKVKFDSSSFFNTPDTSFLLLE